MVMVMVRTSLHDKCGDHVNPMLMTMTRALTLTLNLILIMSGN